MAIPAVKREWMNKYMMKSWINIVNRKSLFNPNALLFMDSKRMHINNKIKNGCKSAKVEVSVMACGLKRIL